MAHLLSRNRKKRGTLLMIATVMVLVVFSAIIVLYAAVHAQARGTRSQRVGLTAEYLAEAGAQIAEHAILTALANHEPVPSGGSVDVKGTRIVYTIASLPGERVTTDEVGVWTMLKPYHVVARTEFQNVPARVNIIMNAALTPIFQYLVFYNNDLEILPGPDMVLAGRIHSNSDIYIGTYDGKTVRVDSNYVRTVGNMYRERKDRQLKTGGEVLFNGASSGVFHNMESKRLFDSMGVPSESGFDSNFMGYDDEPDGDLNGPNDIQNWANRAWDLWEGSVRTSAHNVRKAYVPTVGAIQRYVATASGTGGDYTYDEGTGQYIEVAPGTGDYNKGYFHDRAGLVILDGRAYTSGGIDVTDSLPEGTITEHSMYEGREQQTILVTQIDIEKLNESGYFPSNGLLYAARSDSNPRNPNGVRLANGSELAGPFTVVSENPLYVHGDYNIVDKKGASVIADAVNLLSNAWDDSKVTGRLPSASETTYNVALISGTYVTEPGTYNGGFENLPRFHEDWTGIWCHIRGSFVSLWDNEIAKGTWVYGRDRYQAPDRDWDFDQGFNTYVNLPPFTPLVARTQQVVWWTRAPQPYDIAGGE